MPPGSALVPKSGIPSLFSTLATDLLTVFDHEPPMGDLTTGNRLDAVRSVWTGRRPGERAMPAQRIIHHRILRLPGKARLHRLGVRRAPGFHKCGSRLDEDWIKSLRLLGRVGGRWRELGAWTELPRPRSGDWRWFQLGGVKVEGVVIELRACGIDEGWTPWNLAERGLSLEGELLTPLAPRRERRLVVGEMNLAKMPRGVSVEWKDGELRYQTSRYAVGFRLDRPGFSFLSLAREDETLLKQNLLAISPVRMEQGVHLHPVGEPAVVAPSARCDLQGEVRVKGAVVDYRFTAGRQHYRLTWRVSATGLSLRTTRESGRAEEAWHATPWRIAWRNSVSPTHGIGRLKTVGKTGGLELPVRLNAPGFGTWLIEATGAAGVRCESWRTRDFNRLDLQVGQEATPLGLYRLPAGRHVATFTLKPVTPPERLRRASPAVVRRALARTFFTAATFRADIGTLSNSGVSMPCPICMDTWSAVLPRLGRLDDGFDPWDMLRVSLERWLEGGPGYASGRLSHGGRTHDADDEYLMTGAAALRGIGDYLVGGADRAWFRRFRPLILARLEAARARDLDGDGLIESPHRTGVSGTGQWSTCWADVISFGWKDAWANAILHGALVALVAGCRRHGDETTARDLAQWRERLHASYRPAFWNEASGWLAGWRCREDRLHDYAFLPVNGAAVAEGLLEPTEARSVMQALWAEARRVGMPDPALGLPLNLHPIPDEDRADIMQGYPFGYYQNGGRTHSQARHFLNGLYAVGMRDEADAWLERLCVGFATARVFGGNQSGVDWRDWSDRPTGYEGLLTDQFGVLEPLLRRWGRQGSVS